MTGAGAGLGFEVGSRLAVDFTAEGAADAIALEGVAGGGGMVSLAVGAGATAAGVGAATAGTGDVTVGCLSTGGGGVAVVALRAGGELGRVRL